MQQQTTPRTLQFSQLSSSCPPEFEAIPGGCIYISEERVSWIEARKMCAKRNSVLSSMQTRDKRGIMLRAVLRQMRRRRDEFWLSGNDIEEEGKWEWAKLRSPVSPLFGWIESPYNSHEENCLAWSVEDGDSDWQGAACCNNLRYICETYQAQVVR